MEYTSAEAAKLLRKLNDEHAALLRAESMSMDFLAAVGEDVDSVRPEYDYANTQNALRETERKIRKLKHAINVFNTTHKVPGFGMTIDEMLVYIPQLTQKKAKLDMMRARLPKTRESTAYSKGAPVIDYRYLNYDPKTAAEEYERVSDELSRAQTALDLINTTESIEAEL